MLKYTVRRVKKVKNKKKVVRIMELAKISSKGQITVPVNIRKKLNLKSGDKVLFLEEGSNIIVLNASIVALKKIQKEMDGERIYKDLNSEEEINNFTADIRKEIWKKKYENTD